MFNKDNIKRLISEWIKTFSQRASFFSSKKIERFVFGSAYLSFCYLYIGFAIYNKTFTAMDVTLIGSPLLLAAGYNLAKTEKEKSENKETNGEA